MKLLALALAAALAMPLAAQDKPPPRKKPAVKQLAHKKPTPEQIRKFDELEKKSTEPKK